MRDVELLVDRVLEGKEYVFKWSATWTDNDGTPNVVTKSPPFFTENDAFDAATAYLLAYKAQEDSRGGYPKRYIFKEF